MSRQGKIVTRHFAQSSSSVFFFAAGILLGLFPGIFVAWRLLAPRNPAVPVSTTPVHIGPYIHIKDEDDLKRKRQELVRIIWGDNYQQDRKPFRVVQSINDERIEELKGIERTDRLEVDMEHGIKSFAYLFNPQSGRPLAIYHQGHDGSFFIGKETIQSFIDQGYMVLCFSMPLLGDNNQPTINVSGIGPIEFTEHDRLKFVDHPIQYFMEPVLEGMNFVQDQYEPEHVVMIGYSGGGWSTTLYAAIDPRIDLSFPVAGSLPIVLRNQQDWGDFEQTFPDLYQEVNYLDLYILGSSGRNRAQIQILNQFDSCCFSGTKSLFYETDIAKISTSLGGNFAVYLDDSHKSHLISPAALEIIWNEIKAYDFGL
jgi:hypothetical protein